MDHTPIARPVGGVQIEARFARDPAWRGLLLFHEFFHGETGRGLGASHQTGWTGVIARMMHLFATIDPEKMLEAGKMGYVDMLAAEKS